jgi:hypothetical protein
MGSREFELPPWLEHKREARAKMAVQFDHLMPEPASSLPATFLRQPMLDSLPDLVLRMIFSRELLTYNEMSRLRGVCVCRVNRIKLPTLKQIDSDHAAYDFILGLSPARGIGNAREPSQDCKSGSYSGHLKPAEG